MCLFQESMTYYIVVNESFCILAEFFGLHTKSGLRLTHVNAVTDVMVCDSLWDPRHRDPVDSS